MGMVLGQTIKRVYVILALALLVLAVLPQVPAVPMCPAAFMHHACPTCGVVRGLWHILHGHFQTAWNLNPISYLIIALCARRFLIWRLDQTSLQATSMKEAAAILGSKQADAIFLALFFLAGFSKLTG